jgi:hypothetical protein
MIYKLTCSALMCLLVLFTTSCDDCHEERYEPTLSPDGLWVAQMIVRDCGVPGAAFAVRVFAKGKESTNPEDVVFTFKPYGLPQLEWLSPNELRIHCNCYEHQIYKQRKNYESLKVSHDQIRRL